MSLFPALFLLFLLVTLPRTLLPTLLLLYLPLPQPVTADSLAFENGIQAYREADYKQATKHFSSAVFEADSDEERARALHNLGNSYFNQGNYTAAIQVFQDSLTYRPEHQATLQNLTLSTTIQAELTRRLAAKANESSDNANSGSRLERWSNELDWDQQNTQTWGESKNKTIEKKLPKPLDTANLNQLVDHGFQYLEEAGVANIMAWNKQQQSLADAHIALQKIDTSPADLFKRLFEIEEGFYTKQTEPQTIPKVLAW